MSADNESAINLDQEDVVKSVRELASSVQELCNIITSEHRSSNSGKSRAELKAEDEISSTIYEEIRTGKPEKIIDWEIVESMSFTEIDMEQQQCKQKYEDFWKDIDESTQQERDAAAQGYTLAFSGFDKIYSLMGWNGHANIDALFDTFTLTDFRDLLMESIFGIEAYQMSHFDELYERSRAMFELSRLPRLLTILVRIACLQMKYSACGIETPFIERPFDAVTVIRVLAHAARVYKGGLVKSVSIENFLQQCYARRILTQPDVSNVNDFQDQFHLIYDCLTAVDFTTRFREIRTPFSSLFSIRHKSEPIQRIFDLVKVHEDVTIGICSCPELPLAESRDSTFHPEIFTISYLQDFGGLKVEWTDILDEHLKIYTNRNCIRIFQHPTFLYNAIDLHRDERDYTSPTYLELSKTYALLFRPTSPKNLNRLRQYVEAGKDEQIHWSKCVTFNGAAIYEFSSPWSKEELGDTSEILDINPAKSPTTDILLENFFHCSLPPSIQVALNIANPLTAVKRILKHVDEHKVTSTSMQAILKIAPEYPEDIKFMMISVMQNNFQDTDSFLQFEYFAPRLRKLKMYLDSRKPRTIRELWADRRDYRLWYTSWGTIFLGGCSLILLFAILLVQLGLLLSVR